MGERCDELGPLASASLRSAVALPLAAAASIHYHAEFAGQLPPTADAATMRPVITGGDIRNVSLGPAPDGWAWRCTFELRPGKSPAELRAYLRISQDAVSETWSDTVAP